MVYKLISFVILTSSVFISSTQKCENAESCWTETLQKINDKVQNIDVKRRRGPPGYPGATGPPGPQGTLDLQGLHRKFVVPLIVEPSKMPSISNHIASEEFVIDKKWCLIPEKMFGLEGEPGEKGEMGDPGIQNTNSRSAGIKGESGEKGISNQIGERGAPGQKGPAGRNGTQGHKGSSQTYRGEYGVQGSPGSKGSKGETGTVKPRVILMPTPKNNSSAQRDGVMKILHKPTRNGTTCADLMETFPDFGGGNYWIDPNGGSIDDAIEVSCNMMTGDTCIAATPQELQNITNRDKDYIWLSELTNGVKIKYNASNSQIKYLQLLLPIAQQFVIFHCKNTIAYLNGTTNTYDQALKILAWNDAILTAKGSSKNLRYDILYDGCQNSQIDHWSSTKLFYETNKSDRLPIVDLAVGDFGANKQFSIAIEAVCFGKYPTKYYIPQ